MTNFAFDSFHSDDAFCALLPQVKAEKSNRYNVVMFGSSWIAKNVTHNDSEDMLKETIARMLQNQKKAILSSATRSKLRTTVSVLRATLQLRVI